LLLFLLGDRRPPRDWVALVLSARGGHRNKI